MHSRQTRSHRAYRKPPWTSAALWSAFLGNRKTVNSLACSGGCCTEANPCGVNEGPAALWGILGCLSLVRGLPLQCVRCKYAMVAYLGIIVVEGLLRKNVRIVRYLKPRALGLHDGLGTRRIRGLASSEQQHE